MLDLAIRLIDDKNHIFTFKIKESTYRLRVKDIIYFESMKHNFKIVTKNKNYEFRSSLSDILNQLSDFGFIQVHRSYFVNYDHIKNINYDELTMSNDTLIPISRNKRKDTRELLIKFGG